MRLATYHKDDRSMPEIPSDVEEYCDKCMIRPRGKTHNCAGYTGHGSRPGTRPDAARSWLIYNQQAIVRTAANGRRGNPLNVRRELKTPSKYYVPVECVLRCRTGISAAKKCTCRCGGKTHGTELIESPAGYIGTAMLAAQLRG